MEYTLGVLAIIVNNAPNLVGFILPSVVEAINKDVPSGSERRIVSLLVCLFAAVLLHWNSIAYGTHGCSSRINYLALCRKSDSL